jgi:hypothetical protein
VNLGVSSAPAGGTAGTRALSFDYGPRPNGGDLVLIVPLCDSQGVRFNTTTSTFTFPLFFADDPTSPTRDQFGFQAFHVFHTPGSGPNNIGTVVRADTIRSGAWLTFTSQLFQGSGDLEISTGITFHFAYSAAHLGRYCLAPFVAVRDEHPFHRTELGTTAPAAPAECPLCPRVARFSLRAPHCQQV